MQLNFGLCLGQEQEEVRSYSASHHHLELKILVAISKSKGAVCQTDTYVGDGIMGLLDILNGDVVGQTRSF